MKIIGYEKIDYVSKQTNKRVLGCKLYGALPIKNGEGIKVKEIYIPASSPIFVDIGEGIIDEDVDLLATFDGKFVEMRIN